MNIFKNKTVLVTGAGGSIGSAVCSNLIDSDVKTIKCLDISEYNLYRLQKKFNDDKRIKLIIGDIRDKERLASVVAGTDFIIHTAALKHVTFCEQNPEESFKTNVLGTQNIVKLANFYNVDHSILISTDKSVNPTSIMGTTKYLAEKTFLNNYEDSWNGLESEFLPKFTVVRFGNVFGSAGSVVETFYNQIKNNKILTITDENVSRYFISIEQAANLILDCFTHSEGNKIFILKMNQIKILDLAKKIFDLTSDDKQLFNYKITGLTPGEKLKESLMTEKEKKLCKNFKDYYIINGANEENKIMFNEEPITDKKLELLVNHWLEKKQLINRKKNV